ncbi:MAG: sigma-70 family RNA polymerase sigma factor [Planctomycetia bacterium]|nr:sigma-70 family RNA polymerase sigma factor [Planctomycetia bacterium]MCC7316242.1 sigma-70 family RNA polymerase sigma factor [Planctomycetota bacterium]
MQSWMQPPPYVMNPELARRSIEAKLFADYPGPALGLGRLTPSDETLLFKQLHYSAYRLRHLYRLADTGPTASRRRRYSGWILRYNQLRARLTEGNLGLVYDLIGRRSFDSIEREELVSEGMMALLRAVDTFDPWRGFRFSTYACNAIIRAFSRAGMQESKRRSKIIGRYDPEFDASNAPDVRKADQRLLYSERLQRVLRLDYAGLTDMEKKVLARRFPIEDDRKRQTLEHVGKKMCVSKERVRQIQLSAIAKLRHAIKADGILQ